MTAVTAIAAAPAVARLTVVGIRCWRRNPPGHCRRCGYDLRASPGRCPECGSGDPSVPL